MRRLLLFCCALRCVNGKEGLGDRGESDEGRVKLFIVQSHRSDSCFVVREKQTGNRHNKVAINS